MKFNFKRRKQTGIKTDFGLNFNIKGKPDYLFLAIIIVFVIFGTVMVYNSSFVVAFKTFNDQFSILKNHLFNVGVGIAAFLFFYFWDYRKLGKVSFPALVVSIILLIMVLFLAKDVGGAKRWLVVGGVNIQVSEIAKFAFIIYLSFWLNRAKGKINKLGLAFWDYVKSDMIPFLVLLGIIGTLVLIQPDLGTAAVIALTASLMFFISGDDLTHLLSSALVFLILIAALFGGLFLQSYRQERLSVYTDLLTTGRLSREKALDQGYPQQQVLIAIASGGIWGVGFGESKQKYFYLVDKTAYTDTIFAVIAEEFGLVGCVLIVLGYLALVLRGLKIAQGAPDRVGALLVYGIITWIGMQSFFNIAANVALVPFKGITLPFISYGGASIVVTLAALGIVANISKFTKTK